MISCMMIINLIIVTQRIDFKVLSIDVKLQALIKKFRHELETPDGKEDM